LNDWSIVEVVIYYRIYIVGFPIAQGGVKIAGLNQGSNLNCISRTLIEIIVINSWLGNSSVPSNGYIYTHRILKKVVELDGDSGPSANDGGFILVKIVVLDYMVKVTERINGIAVGDEVVVFDPDRLTLRAQPIQARVNDVVLQDVVDCWAVYPLVIKNGYGSQAVKRTVEDVCPRCPGIDSSIGEPEIAV
jgi:hypothetical protein